MRYHEIRQGITESPQQVDPISFSLENKDYNIKFVEDRLEKVVEVIEDNPTHAIVRTGDDQNGWIFLYTKTIPLHAEYAVRYESNNQKWRWLPDSVTQCILWRDKLGGYTRDLTARIFFDYLLPRFGSIMSDRQQSDLGHDFWQNRMVNAALRGMKVGIVDALKKEVDWFDQTKFDPAAGLAQNSKEWLSSKNTFGKEHKFQAIRYIISQ